MSDLRAYEEAFVALCFSEHISDEVLATLGGDDSRWRLYREMVRMRIREVLQTAFSRTHAALGAEEFVRQCDQAMTRLPPSTHFLRDVAVDFASHVKTHSDTARPWLHDLVTLEAAEWQAMHEPENSISDLNEFDFDRIPTVDSRARLLFLDWNVHEKHLPFERFRNERSAACVYRHATEHRVEVWALNEMAAKLFQGWSRGNETAKQTIERVLAESGSHADAHYLDALGEMLANFIERGIIRGSRA